MERLALNMQKKIGNFVLQVKELTHHRPPILMEQAYWNMELTAGPIPETPGVHASIVEVTDQTGRSIGPGISPGRGAQ